MFIYATDAANIAVVGMVKLTPHCFHVFKHAETRKALNRRREIPDKGPQYYPLRNGHNGEPIQ